MNMAFSAPQPQMMPVMMPMPQASASGSFYQSSTNPMMAPIAPTYNTTNYNDSNINELESRMAKIERSLNRLENRINKLEGTTIYSNDTTYESTSNGMYMV